MLYTTENMRNLTVTRLTLHQTVCFIMLMRVGFMLDQAKNEVTLWRLFVVDQHPYHKFKPSGWQGGYCPPAGSPAGEWP